MANMAAKMLLAGILHAELLLPFQEVRNGTIKRIIRLPQMAILQQPFVHILSAFPEAHETQQQTNAWRKGGEMRGMQTVKDKQSN